MLSDNIKQIKEETNFDSYHRVIGLVVKYETRNPKSVDLIAGMI